MGFYENGLERIAAVCVGTTAVAFGIPPGSIEASIGVAGLLGFILGKSQKFGPETARVRNRIRKKLLSDYKSFVQIEADGLALNDELQKADKALRASLNDCIIDRSKLAKSAVTPKGFPEGAIAVVMVGLAQKHKDLFGEGKETSLGYRYAHDVIKAGIDAAVENIDYYKQLEPQLMFEMAQALGEIRETVKDNNAILNEVKATTDKLVELLSPQANDFKIKEQMLIVLAQRYAEGSPLDFEAAYAGLERALEVAAADRDKRKLPANSDDAVNDIIIQVDALNEAGRIDTAATLLANEEARVQSGLIRLYDKAISQAVLTRDVEAAVVYELKKLPPEAPKSENSYFYLHSIFMAWYQRGRDKGLNFDAEVAIMLMRDMAARFDTDQNKKGACLTNLGIALWALGAREGGTERLQEAVAAHREALKERTRDRVPLDWAATQMNLGITLQALGERESGTKWLQEAVAAYRAALRERTRGRVPLDWALTQMNLGVTLETLGERESDTKKLQQAIAAYRASLEERTRDRVPLDWAKTQVNLGNALRILGERESGTERIQEAITAFRAALQEWTRDRVPLDWANSQLNLGSALYTLGERGSGTERLIEAVAAFRAALEENTRDRVPLDWANTIGNEAIALVTLAERTNDAATASRALDQLVEAEAVLREGGHEAWAKTFSDAIPKAETLLSRLKANT